MFSKPVRFTALTIIAVAAFTFALGAVLNQAAFITKADSDYTVSVTWWSALSSVLRQPSGIPFLALVSIAALAAFTTVTFFRFPRALGVAVLFLQAGVGYLFGGSLGAFFLRREFERYHFAMDAERLGENWFTYEAVALWSVAAVALALLRLAVRKRPAA